MDQASPRRAAVEGAALLRGAERERGAVEIAVAVILAEPAEEGAVEDDSPATLTVRCGTNCPRCG